MDSVSLDKIAGLLILVAGLISSILFDGIFRASLAPDRTEVIYALCTFALPTVILFAGWLVFKATSHDQKFEKIAELSKDLKIHAKALNTALGLVNDLLAKQSRLAEIQNELIADATSRFVRSYVDAFKIEASTFIFNDQKWSLYYNSIFWSSMIEAQKESKKTPICVFATHTLDPDVWQGEAAESSLNEQKDFTTHNGRIMRIFVRQVAIRDAKPKIPQEYLKMMKYMEEKFNIQTYYAEVGKDFKVDDATWVPALDVYMQWPEVGNFRISNGRGEADEFKKAWRVLEARAIDTNNQLIPKDSGIEKHVPGFGT